MADNAWIQIASTLPPTGDVGDSPAARSAIAFRDHVSPSALGKKLAEFTHALGTSLDCIREVGSDFSLDEIEVHALMSADGTLTLLGTGVSTSVEGGLKLVFKRKSARDGAQRGHEAAVRRT